MKMKNETKNVNEHTVAKPKRCKKEHVFFLYVEGNGFLRANNDGYPTLDEKCALLKYTERKQAFFAAKFFKPFVKSGDIAVFTNVA